MFESAHKDRTFFALVMAVLGVTCICSTDLATKLITGEYSIWQILLYRSGLGFLIVLPILALLGRLKAAIPIRFSHVFLRSMLMMGSYLAFVGALATLPMAVVAGGFFSAPIFMLLLSWLFLGEQIGHWRILAVALGFIGVLLVLRPDAEGFNYTYFLAPLAAFLYASSQIYTRKYCIMEDSYTLSIWVAFCFMLCGIFGLLLLALLPDWQGISVYQMPHVQPLGWHWWLFIGIGIGSFFMHFAFAAAYQNAPATLVAPMEYLYLPLAVVGGYWLFDEIPHSSAGLGIALIMFVGLLITWREHHHRKSSE